MSRAKNLFVTTDSQSNESPGPVALQGTGAARNLLHDGVLVPASVRHRFPGGLGFTGGDSIARDATKGLSSLTAESAVSACWSCVPCTFGQGTGLHSLTLHARNTGLTSKATEFSMS